MRTDLPRIEILHDHVSAEDSEAIFDAQPRSTQNAFFLTVLAFIGLSFASRLIPTQVHLRLIGVFFLAVIYFIYLRTQRKERILRWKQLQERAFNKIDQKVKLTNNLDSKLTYLSKSPVCSFIALAKDRNFLITFSVGLTCDALKVPISCIKEVNFGLAQDVLDKNTVSSLGIENQYVIVLDFYEHGPICAAWAFLGEDELKAKQFYDEIDRNCQKTSEDLKKELLAAEDTLMDQQVEEIVEWLDQSEKKSLQNFEILIAVLLVIPVISAYTLGDSIERPFSIFASVFLGLGFFWSDLKKVTKQLLSKVETINQNGFTNEGKEKLSYKITSFVLTGILALPFIIIFHRAMLNSVYPIWTHFSSNKQVLAVATMDRDSTSLNLFRRFSIHGNFSNGESFRYYLRPSQLSFPKQGNYLVRISGPQDVLVWSVEQVCIMVDPGKQPIPANGVIANSLNKESIIKADCL